MPPIALWFAQANQFFNAQLSTHFRSLDEGGLLPALWVLGIAFVYGVLHAIGPGHGKALVAGYFLANDGKKKDVFKIGFLIALVHASSALILTIVAYYILEKTASKILREMGGTLTQMTGGLIVLIGIWLIYEIIASKMTSPNQNGKKVQKLSVVLLAGIIPCPGVMTIAFFAITIGHILLGIFAALAMSIGMGVTISVAGLFANKFQQSSFLKRHFKWLMMVRMIGAFIVIGLGVLLLMTPSVTKPF